MRTESRKGNDQWEMPDKGHHAMYRLSFTPNCPCWILSVSILYNDLNCTKYFKNSHYALNTVNRVFNKPYYYIVLVLCNKSAAYACMESCSSLRWSMLTKCCYNCLPNIATLGAYKHYCSILEYRPSLYCRVERLLYDMSLLH